MLVGIKAISTSSSAATLVAFCLIVTMVFGIDTVLFVVLSRDVLGTGAEGYGYLLAGLGVGGVLAAGLVTRLERRPRLGLSSGWARPGTACPPLLFLVVDDPTLAFVIQCVRGASTLVVDVLAITALQRSLPNDLLGRVFGAFNALCLLAILIGSSVVPFGISWFGLDAVLWATGLGIPVLCLAGWPWLRRMDKEAALRRTAMAPKLALLARCNLFASVSEGALDQLAGAADFVDTEPATVIVRQGEPADAFYVIDAGAFSVSALGEAGRGHRPAGHGGGRLLRRDRLDRGHPTHCHRDRPDRRPTATRRRSVLRGGPDPGGPLGSADGRRIGTAQQDQPTRTAVTSRHHSHQ